MTAGPQIDTPIHAETFAMLRRDGWLIVAERESDRDKWQYSFGPECEIRWRNAMHARRVVAVSRRDVHPHVLFGKLPA